MENASIGVIGVTGFVGRYLARSLAQKGYRVVGFSRAGKGTCVGVTEWRSSHMLDFSGLHGVVNLAGERIDQRWTEANRVKFAESRVGITQRIVKQLSAMELGQRPKVWINASAVGFYANRGDELLPESSTAGAGYLADLCVDWEKSTTGADQLGVRCVMVRIGMVLEDVLDIAANGTLMIIGRVSIVQTESVADDGSLDLCALESVASTALDTYFGITPLARFAYAKADRQPKRL